MTELDLVWVLDLALAPWSAERCVGLNQEHCAAARREGPMPPLLGMARIAADAENALVGDQTIALQEDVLLPAFVVDVANGESTPGAR